LGLAVEGVRMTWSFLVGGSPALALSARDRGAFWLVFAGLILLCVVACLLAEEPPGNTILASLCFGLPSGFVLGALAVRSLLLRQHHQQPASPISPPAADSLPEGVPPDDDRFTHLP